MSDFNKSIFREWMHSNNNSTAAVNEKKEK